MIISGKELGVTPSISKKLSVINVSLLLKSFFFFEKSKSIRQRQHQPKKTKKMSNEDT